MTDLEKQAVEACRDCIEMFESWRDGIFHNIGVHWEQEPKGIEKARYVLLLATRAGGKGP